MKNVTKKFVAAVLVLAMVLSTGITAFAVPTNEHWSQLDPTRAVSLTIHHLEGQVDGGIAGPWITGPAPSGHSYVTGSVWRMARLLPPAGWETATLAVPPAPASQANVSTAPVEVRNALINGTALPSGWTITSDGTTAALRPEIPAAGGNPAVPEVPAIAGAHEQTSAGAPLTFDAAMLAITTASPADPGQGLWIVWEVPSAATEAVDLIHPFLVNLPTFTHYPAGPSVDEPGDWLYNVHVWPKQAAPPETNKTIGDVVLIPPNDVTRIDWTMSMGIMIDLDMTESVQSNDVSATPPIVDRFPHTLPVSGQQPSYIIFTDQLQGMLRLETHTHAASTPGTAWHPTYRVQVRYQTNTAGDMAVLSPGTGASANWFLVVDTPAATTPPDPQTFYVHITREGLETIVDNGYVGGVIEVYFYTLATFSRQEDLGEITNNFTLNYGRRPSYHLNERRPDDGGRRTHGGGLDVRKVNPGGQPLTGAVFFLFAHQFGYYDASDTWVSNNPTGWTSQVTGAGTTDVARATGAVPYRRAISGGVAGTTITRPLSPASDVITDADWGLIETIPAHPNAASELPEHAIARFLNLPPGIYYLYEIIAPGQYNRVTSLTRIVIAPVECTVDHVCPEDGATCVFPANYSSIPFQNTRDFTLPMTGGAGTIMFTTAGVSLMGIAGLFLFLSRKKEKVKHVRTIQ